MKSSTTVSAPPQTSPMLLNDEWTSKVSLSRIPALRRSAASDAMVCMSVYPSWLISVDVKAFFRANPDSEIQRQDPFCPLSPIIISLKNVFSICRFCKYVKKHYIINENSMTGPPCGQNTDFRRAHVIFSWRGLAPFRGVFRGIIEQRGIHGRQWKEIEGKIHISHLL